MNLDERIKYLESKGLKKKSKRRWYKKWWGIFLLLLLYLIIIFSIAFVIFLFKFLSSPDLQEAHFLNNNKNIEIIQKNKNEEIAIKRKIVEGINSPFLGNPDSEIVITVFSDFSCPYCKQASETLSAVSLMYGQKVKFISREYSILGDDSSLFAISALCAKEQGKYWPMYNKLFELQDQFDSSQLTNIAKIAGITNLEEFSKCMNDDRHKNSLLQGLVDGQFLEIKGTPAWFINGEKIYEGVLPFEAFSDFLEKIIIN